MTQDSLLGKAQTASCRALWQDLPKSWLYSWLAKSLSVATVNASHKQIFSFSHHRYSLQFTAKYTSGVPVFTSLLCMFETLLIMCFHLLKNISTHCVVCSSSFSFPDKFGETWLCYCSSLSELHISNHQGTAAWELKPSVLTSKILHQPRLDVHIISASIFLKFEI